MDLRRRIEEEPLVGKRILAIDDEAMILDTVKMILEDLGYSVDTASDPVLGTEMALRGDYDLIITDLRMPGRNGAQVAEAVLAGKPSARILAMTAYPEDPIALRARKAGILGLLGKPFAVADILAFLI